jgi:hypothetical protein
MSKNYIRRLKNQPQTERLHSRAGRRKAEFANTGGAWQHAPAPVPPSRRDTAGSPLPTVQDQKMAKRGRHARRTAETPLARAGHAPSSGNRRDLCDRQQERTATDLPTKRRVSRGKHRASVDLASNICKKTIKNRPNQHSSGDTNPATLPTIPDA